MIDAPNVSVYADEPEVIDADTARRSETLTLIVDGPGEITVPAVEINYWNTSSAAIESVVTEGFTVSVAGATETAGADVRMAQRDPRRLAIGAAVALLLVVLFWKGLPVAAENAPRIRRKAACQRALCIPASSRPAAHA